MNNETRSVLSKMFLVPIKDASVPRSGVYRVYVDHWWCVTPDDEIMLYLGAYPQCNADEEVIRRIGERLYPDFEVRKLPLILINAN